MRRIGDGGEGVVGSDLGSEPAVTTSRFLFVSPVCRHIPDWVTMTRVDILSASLLFNHHVG